VLQIVPAFIWLEQIADGAEGAPKRVKGPGFGFAQMRFDLDEGLFSWVQIGRVRGQKQEPGSLFLQTLGGFFALVGGLRLLNA